MAAQCMALLTGFPPFCAEEPKETYHKIMNWKKYLIFSPELPPISPQAEQLIRRYRVLPYICDPVHCFHSFLCDPTERIGQKVEDIKFHPFFRGIDWDHIR